MGGHKLFYIKSGWGARKQHIIVYKMTSVSKKWGGQRKFWEKTIGGAASFSLLEYGGADRFHEKKFGGAKSYFDG